MMDCFPMTECDIAAGAPGTVEQPNPRLYGKGYGGGSWKMLLSELLCGQRDELWLFQFPEPLLALEAIGPAMVLLHSCLHRHPLSKL